MKKNLYYTLRKLALLFALAAITSTVSAQRGSTRVLSSHFPIIGFSNSIVISKYDTVVIFKGLDTVPHVHQFVSHSNKPQTNISCSVNHDEAGCPNFWLDEDIICEVCLRNCTVKETRTTQPPPPDPYEAAKQRLLNLKSNK